MIQEAEEAAAIAERKLHDDYEESCSESENDPNNIDENDDYDSDDDDDEENDDDNGNYSIEYDDNAGYGSGEGDIPDNAQKYEEHSVNAKEINGSYSKKDSLTTTQPPMIRKPNDQSTNNNSRNVESRRNASSSAKTNCKDKYHLEVECAQNNADTEMSKNSDFFAAITDKYEKEKIQGVSPGCSDSICSDKEDQKVSYCLYYLHFDNYKLHLY